MIAGVLSIAIGLHGLFEAPLNLSSPFGTLMSLIITPRTAQRLKENDPFPISVFTVEDAKSGTQRDFNVWTSGQENKPHSKFMTDLGFVHVFTVWSPTAPDSWSVFTHSEFVVACCNGAIEFVFVQYFMEVNQWKFNGLSEIRSSAKDTAYTSACFESPDGARAISLTLVCANGKHWREHEDSTLSERSFVWPNELELQLRPFDRR